VKEDMDGADRVNFRIVALKPCLPVRLPADHAMSLHEAIAERFPSRCYPGDARQTCFSRSRQSQSSVSFGKV
jgi:hypothetical protein